MDELAELKQELIEAYVTIDVLTNQQLEADERCIEVENRCHILIQALKAIATPGELKLVMESIGKQ